MVAVKVFVDVKRIEGGVKSTVSGTETEAALGFCHQRVEIGDVGPIEGQGNWRRSRSPEPGPLPRQTAESVLDWWCGQGAHPTLPRWKARPPGGNLITAILTGSGGGAASGPMSRIWESRTVVHCERPIISC